MVVMLLYSLPVISCESVSGIARIFGKGSVGCATG